jgi:hypothetical protein
MDHAAEGTLQAYLDDEIDSAAQAALRAHVEACTACAAELEALRRAGQRVGTALAELDRPAPVLRARAAVARERSAGGGRRMARLGAWSLAKAAMLLLVLAGATAAAIPDVRRALETTISRVAAIFGAGQAREAAVPIEPVPAEPLDEPEESESFVAPATGRVQILLHAPTGRLDVVVRLIDGEQAQVLTRTVDGPVRRRVGTGRLELMNLGAGTVTIGVPRSVASATVEIDGEIAVYKQGTTLRGAGPEAETRGTEVRFTTGS